MIYNIRTLSLGVLLTVCLAACGGSSDDSVVDGGVALSNLNDTGQTQFSDSVDFVAVQSSHPGQDGSYGRDALIISGQLSKTGDGAAGFDFTKIDADGNDLDKLATSWSCVRDNVTGLVWENQTETESNLRYTPTTALTKVDTVNTGGLCGSVNWRLPERKELLSIVHYGLTVSGRSIDEDYFPYTAPVSNYYWASERDTSNSENAWGVSFSGGSSSSYYEINNFHIRLVSGVSLSPRFTNNNNGTVSDENTGLIWKKCSEGQTWNGVTNLCDGSVLDYTWQLALQQTQDVNAGSVGEKLGYGDWRLPNIKELSSITDLTKTNPGIDTTIFPSTPSNKYWSSTPNTNYATIAWVVNYSQGSPWDAQVTSLHNVRLVRGGQ